MYVIFLCNVVVVVMICSVVTLGLVIHILSTHIGKHWYVIWDVDFCNHDIYILAEVTFRVTARLAQRFALFGLPP